MTESDSTQPRQLPDELERALGQATARTLESLAVLRKALRQHVRSERDHGITLTELQGQLRALVTRSESRSNNSPRSAGGYGSLADQVVQWSERYFSQSD